MKMIKSLFKKETQALFPWDNSEFQISSNDKYLCYSSNESKSYIIDIETNKVVFESDNNKLSGSIYNQDRC
jgi:hypothetical protein